MPLIAPADIWQIGGIPGGSSAARAHDVPGAGQVGRECKATREYPSERTCVCVSEGRTASTQRSRSRPPAARHEEAPGEDRGFVAEEESQDRRASDALLTL
jgi:hypothetical protein